MSVLFVAQRSHVHCMINRMAVFFGCQMDGEIEWRLWQLLESYTLSVLSEVFVILVVIGLGIGITSLCGYVNDFHKPAFAFFIQNLCS